MTHRSHKINRTELYEQVWTEPISKIAPRFGLSDVGLAKVCKRLNVPRPERGYWAKLANGKPVKKTPLGEAINGQEEVLIYEKSGKEAPEPSLEVKNAMELESGENRISVPADLVAPHKLIILIVVGSETWDETSILPHLF